MIQGLHSGTSPKTSTQKQNPLLLQTHSWAREQRVLQNRCLWSQPRRIGPGSAHWARPQHAGLYAIMPSYKVTRGEQDFFCKLKVLSCRMRCSAVKQHWN